jgi:hypothetical protein
VKTLRLLPLSVILFCRFAPACLSAGNDPVSFPDGPAAYGDKQSLERAGDLKLPASAAVFRSAVGEVGLHQGYFPAFRDPNQKPRLRPRVKDVIFDFSTGHWINPANGDQVRDVLVPWGNGYLSVDLDGSGTIFGEDAIQRGVLTRRPIVSAPTPFRFWGAGSPGPTATSTKSSVVPANVAVAEPAAGFPGEVIDEVIVPVPSEIFLVLDKLGKPDWKGQLRTGKQPSLSKRIDVSLLLGSVVAEGFVAVQAEDRSAVEQIGKDVLRLSESLGLKETVLPHTNSILEASKHSHWEIVRVELDKTQKTVRDTMEQRRDAELAQCVSLGGWLRGTEAVTDLIGKNYTSDSAELLNQPDIVRHFQKELKKLASRNQKLRNMLAGLETIAGVIGTGDEPPNAGGVQTIHTTTAKLVKSIATPSR